MRDMPDTRDLPLHELRFSTRAAWAAAFDRVVAHPSTQLCVAQRRNLTLRVRTDDSSVLKRVSASPRRSEPPESG